jgi:hypothetical protein
MFPLLFPSYRERFFLVPFDVLKLGSQQYQLLQLHSSAGNKGCAPNVHSQQY